MGAQSGGNTIVRTIIPVMLTLAVLGILLSLYFLKYIPDSQGRYNDRAYMELQQVAKAVQRRDNGYVQAIRYYLLKPQSSSPLLQVFRCYPRRPEEGDSNITVRPAMLRPDGFNGDTWRLTYPLVHATTATTPAPTTHRPAPAARPAATVGPVARTAGPGTSVNDTLFMSTSLDSLLTPLIATYRDIFSNYLVIGDDKTILYNSENLPLGSQFDPDTISKKSDGLNPLNIHDISIEGTAHKLFLYPLQVGATHITLAGLISTRDYIRGYKDIPLDLFVPAGIIILLLIICLPMLKIFILGDGESITDWNIRQIIGSYFVAAFTCFFLFSWLFLNRAQSADDYSTLRRLSRKIKADFQQEIDTICRQLKVWDTAYARLSGTTKDSTLISGLRGETLLKKEDSTRLDSVFATSIYPYTDVAFWIDTSGKWVATWSGKKGFNKPNLLQVGDRDYFRDFVNQKYLTRRWHYTIQPTLSRLDGEYTITIVIESIAAAKRMRRKNADSLVRRAWLVGLSSQMHSVTNTVLPQGYSFSIIDENGAVQYDAKPGRALLSNITKETDQASKLLECARYRNHRYFSHFPLRGRDVALEVMPMEGTPYTLLAWSDLSGADDFQVHVIGLSAFFTIVIVALLIISTLINEWTGKKPGILLAPPLHFEWLRPRQHKRRYYLHLIIGMSAMALIYVAAWVSISFMTREKEFALFFITLSLPFYVSLYYYTLREKERKHRSFAKPLIPLVIFFSLLLLLLIFISSSRCSTSAIPWLFLLFQALFLGAYLLFVTVFSPTYLNEPANGRLAWLKRRVFALTNGRRISWFRCYALAIVFGVFLISVVPACGIFWLFFRQETGLKRNSTRLEIARMVSQRRVSINKRAALYKFADTSNPRRLAQLYAAKFRHGIYLVRNERLLADTVDMGAPFYPAARQYVGMHACFFPGDTSVLAGAGSPDAAMDGAWHFSTPPGDLQTPIRLDYTDLTDHVNPGPLRLEGGQEASWSSLGLIRRTDKSIGWLFMVLFYLAQLGIVFLVYKLTRALATRIFLIDMFHNGLQFCYDIRPREMMTSPNLPPGFSLLMAALRAEEKDEELDPIDKAETILRNRATHAALFEERWSTLKPAQKFVLFDMARDGFPNYRTGNIIFDLLNERLLDFRKNGHLELITPSFREFVLLKAEDPEVMAAVKSSRQKGQWLSFKTGLTILFTAFGLFIFFTQDALFQKLTGLLASLLSLSTQFSNLFDKTVPRSPNDGTSSSANGS